MGISTALDPAESFPTENTISQFADEKSLKTVAMSMFRKPKKSLRNRGPIGVEDEENEEQDDSIVEIYSNINKVKEKKKEKKKKSEKIKDEKKSLLSFDDDLEEDVEEFKIKKSKESRRLIKQKEKDKKENVGAHHNINDKPSGSPERDNNDSKNGHNDVKKIIDDDLEIVLKVAR